MKQNLKFVLVWTISVNKNKCNYSHLFDKRAVANNV